MKLIAVLPRGTFPQPTSCTSFSKDPFFLSFFFLSQSTSAQTQSALSLVRKLRDFSKGVLSASGSKEYLENSKSQDPLSFFFFLF